MKCLTIVVDEKTLFSGEIAEYQFNESDETVSVAARLNPKQGFLDMLKQHTAVQKPDPAPESNDSPPAIAPRLRPVRDEPETPEP